MSTSNALDANGQLRMAALRQAQSFPRAEDAEIEVHETHISWVFLVGDYAYKIKKPIKTDFLDYRRLEDRHRYCQEELRLDSRFAKDLYIDVVPIALQGGVPIVEGHGTPVEYALKMWRFPSDALMSQQLSSGSVTPAEILQLSETIAQAHLSATPAQLDIREQIQPILTSAVDNLSELQPRVAGELAEMMQQLQHWTRDTFEELELTFSERGQLGYIRECHGDLHLGNIVKWKGRYIPFDGIEFNDQFRVIDVLSDAAFLTMDLLSHHRADYRNLFINDYLEQTDDRSELAILRWYEVYRALVRAKVASIRAEQLHERHAQAAAATTERDEHIRLAHSLCHAAEPCLFITHGVSGSGKTTASQQVVMQWGAIRIRSDVERKRLFGLQVTARSDDQAKADLYSPTTTQATYARLLNAAHDVLAAGYSVVLDATFLSSRDRHAAHLLALRLGVDFAILDCKADASIIAERIRERRHRGTDASDADLRVVQRQLENCDPLSEAEQQSVVDLKPRSVDDW